MPGGSDQAVGGWLRNRGRCGRGKTSVAGRGGLCRAAGWASAAENHRQANCRADRPSQSLRKDSFSRLVNWLVGPCGDSPAYGDSQPAVSDSGCRHHQNRRATGPGVFPASPAARGHPGDHPSAAGVEGFANWAGFWGLTGYKSRKSTFIRA